jgi:cytochrome c oxidase assembly protein subunit 15
MTSDAPLSADARSRARRAGLAVAGIAAAAWCLVIVGALVRAHGAGLACPDWPLCFGELVPAFDLKVAFEWGHRVMAGALSLALVGLAAYVLTNRELRARYRTPLAFIFAILGVQIVLGGLTVLLGLAPWTVTAHLLTGNAFVISLLWLSRGLLEGARATPVARAAVPGALAGLVSACAVLVVLQFLLGGLVASHYAGLACTTFPLCNGDSLAPTLTGPVGLQVLHRLNAYAVTVAFALFAWRARGNARLGPLALAGFGLVLAQVAVGVANVLLLLPIEITALHSALASAIALLTALAVREVLASRASATARVTRGERGGQLLEGAR